MRAPFVLLGLALLFAAGGCNLETDPFGMPCSSDVECGEGFFCFRAEQACVPEGGLWHREDGGSESDAGAETDAGAELDAGAEPDAGPETDAGPELDAGSELDAGAEPDAGASLDGGPSQDAGPLVDGGAFFDAGLEADAGPLPDAGPGTDAGVLVDSGPLDAGPTSDAGDTCSGAQLLLDTSTLLFTTENGASDSTTLRLGKAPSGLVEVFLEVSDSEEAVLVGATTASFDAGDWDTPFQVLVQGVQDFVYDGDTPFTLTATVTSSDDPCYDSQAASADGSNQAFDRKLKLSTLPISGDLFGSGNLDSACPFGWKALVYLAGTRTPTLLDWPLLANTSYYRDTNPPLYIVKTDAFKKLPTSGWTRSIDVFATPVWTGADISWNADANCNGWTNASSGQNGRVGSALGTGTQAWSNQTLACNTSNVKVLCAKQNPN